MTVNKRKKNSRYRGSKTHGCGSMKKRRGAGHRGGRGNAGSGKRADSKKPSYWGDENYFGKNGFTSKSRTLHHPTINVGYLDLHISGFVDRKEAAKEKDFYSINLDKLGYVKLLGEGQVRNKLRIAVSQCSLQAKEKVEAAGGAVSLSDAASQPEKE
jgi:large subunit ribosomal protein L15